MNKVALMIAGVRVLMKSRFPLRKENARDVSEWTVRFKNFLVPADQRADIVIDVEVVDKLPGLNNAETFFVTYHPHDGKENWRLSKIRGGTAFQSPLAGKEQVMVVNQDHTFVTAYLLRKRDAGFTWRFQDIVYDFLQVHLINYFARRKRGFFVHAVGLKDTDGQGYVFAGKSGCGKSTTARIWHRHSKAKVLNDDRVIVTKNRGFFEIHGSPWHGEFSDYLVSRMESARLSKVFFVFHAPKNTCQALSPVQAFGFLYPSLFAPFWDKIFLENVGRLAQALVEKTASYRFGFAKNKTIIDFVRESPHERG